MAPWKPEEDDALQQAVANRLPARPHWPLICGSVHGRTSKQCRERWIHHLDPRIRKGAWSLEEDRLLAQLVKTNGRKWAAISRHADFRGRTDNDIKNRFATLRKRIDFGELDGAKRALPLEPELRDILSHIDSDAIVGCALECEEQAGTQAGTSHRLAKRVPAEARACVLKLQLPTSHLSFAFTGRAGVWR